MFLQSIFSSSSWDVRRCMLPRAPFRIDIRAVRSSRPHAVAFWTIFAYASWCGDPTFSRERARPLHGNELAVTSWKQWCGVDGFAPASSDARYISTTYPCSFDSMWAHNELANVPGHRQRVGSPWSVPASSSINSQVHLVTRTRLGSCRTTRHVGEGKKLRLGFHRPDLHRLKGESTCKGTKDSATLVAHSQSSNCAQS